MIGFYVIQEQIELLAAKSSPGKLASCVAFDVGKVKIGSGFYEHTKYGHFFSKVLLQKDVQRSFFLVVGNVRIGACFEQYGY